MDGVGNFQTNLFGFMVLWVYGFGIWGGGALSVVLCYVMLCYVTYQYLGILCWLCCLGMGG